MRVLMESAFDCGLNYYRNKIDKSKDGSRECDYMSCEYTCNDMNMEVVKKGLNNDELDYSTYQLYYIDSKLSNVQQKIISR